RDRNPGTGDVAALIGSQKDIHRCELGWLARPAQGSVLAERSDLFRRHRRRDQRRPDRSRRHAVNPNTLLPQQLRPDWRTDWRWPPWWRRRAPELEKACRS